MIGVPSVLAPTVEAMVAVPILTMTEVRIPAGSPGPPAEAPPYTDAASRSFPSLQPHLTPRGGIEPSPASVPCSTGSMPYNARAISAGSQPKPSTGTAIASTATGGKVCPI